MKSITWIRSGGAAKGYRAHDEQRWESGQQKARQLAEVSLRRSCFEHAFAGLSAGGPGRRRGSKACAVVAERPAAQRTACSPVVAAEDTENCQTKVSALGREIGTTGCSRLSVRNSYLCCNLG